LTVTLATLLSVALALLTTPASAQSAPTIADGGVANTFPDGMRFSVSAESDSPIEEIKLRYKILPDGTAAIARPEFDPAASVATSLELGGDDLYLPPGTVVEYHWEVTDAEGDEARTETASFFYDDARFQWTPIEFNGVTVYYYSGSEGEAQEMLQTSGETIESMSQLLGTEIDFPVKIWIYDSVDDMRPALPRLLAKGGTGAKKQQKRDAGFHGIPPWFRGLPFSVPGCRCEAQYVLFRQRAQLSALCPCVTEHSGQYFSPIPAARGRPSCGAA